MLNQRTTEAMTIVTASAQHLFPNLSLEQAFGELLLAQARKNLIHYRAMVHRFEQKHQQTFALFRQQILTGEPAWEAEQDYFDWEMAVTGIADMKREIERLQTLVQH